MHISRIQIRNFRNFKNLDVQLGANTVVLGENRVGKSNFLFALRLLLDPTLPDSSRRLRLDDFWDGIPRPLAADAAVEIAIELSQFEENENLLAILVDHAISHTPMVSKLTYRYQPRADLSAGPSREADYEFVIFGGGRAENSVGYNLRRWMPLDLFPALRDAEADLARWSRSPLRPLLDRAAAIVDEATLNTIASAIQEATEQVTELDALDDVVAAVNDQLVLMMGSSDAIDTALGFAPTDPNRLLRALQLLVDGGRRGVSEASLGSANVLYLALKQLEQQYQIDEGERQHTFLAIEEPEAHLHPHLQRMIYRNFLQSRGGLEDDSAFQNIFLTTHSPNIVSVAPLSNIMVLRRNAKDGSTIGRSLTKVATSLVSEVIEDLERYIDVSRGEIFFAKAVLLVEGDSERLMVATLAKLHYPDFDFDELGISICSVGGTNFAPYTKLLGSGGLDIPFAILTDFDPHGADGIQEDRETTDASSYGTQRIVDLAWSIMSASEKGIHKSFEQVFAFAPSKGLFLNEYTFEVDLYKNGAESAFSQAVEGVTSNKAMKARFLAWGSGLQVLDEKQFLKDIESIGKGRFSQRMASVLQKEQLDVCPPYIVAALDYLRAALQ